MSRWFRVYDNLVEDPKVQRLSDSLFRGLVNLWCLASQGDGLLPTVGDIAFKLRIKPVQAQKLLAELRKAGLIVDDETGTHPHNWSGRQYKSDVSNDRVKRYRERKCNVTKTVTETPPETEYREQIQKEDRIGDAGASSFTEGSKALADAFLKALGFLTPLSVPPELAGTDWRAIGWESAGWTVDLIDAEARRIGPDKPLSYYEKVFATAFAKRQAPLPTVEIRPSEKVIVNGTAQKPGVVAVAKRWAEHFESQSGNGFEGDPVSILRISEG